MKPRKDPDVRRYVDLYETRISPPHNGIWAIYARDDLSDFKASNQLLYSIDEVLATYKMFLERCPTLIDVKGQVRLLDMSQPMLHFESMEDDLWVLLRLQFG